jgi:hypothetical protein
MSSKIMSVDFLFIFSSLSLIFVFGSDVLGVVAPPNLLSGLIPFSETVFLFWRNGVLDDVPYVLFHFIVSQWSEPSAKWYQEEILSS